jgi:mono/diheme cytochrome c family protein
MTDSKPISRHWPVPIVLALLGLGFAALMVVTLSNQAPAESTSTSVISESELDALLANADAQRGAQLVTQFECAACHILGAENGIAPPFAGIGQRAAARLPGLTAAQYLHQSIVDPMVYIVPDFPPAMATNYGTRLTPEQLGDIIAHLLTQ